MKHRLAVFFFSSAILALSSCASLQKSGAALATDDRPSRVYDAHTHTHFTGKVGDAGFPDTEAERMRQFAKAGVVASVVHTSFVKREDLDWKKLKSVACFGVSKNPDLKALEKAVTKEGYRCFKIYLGYEHQAATHPNYLKVYRLAEKFHKVVVFHTGDTLDPNGLVKYADPLAIDEIAVKYRGVKFVIAHLGNPWIQTAAEVIYKNENVYADVSALVVGNLADYTPEYLEEYVAKPIRWAWGYVENPKKLMYGSDWPLVETGAYIDAVKNAVPREHWDRFFYQNAVDVFGSP